MECVTLCACRSTPTTAGRHVMHTTRRSLPVWSADAEAPCPVCCAVLCLTTRDCKACLRVSRSRAMPACTAL